MFFFFIVLKVLLNCSCSINVSYCFAQLFAVVFADVTGIRIIDAFLY